MKQTLEVEEIESLRLKNVKVLYTIPAERSLFGVPVSMYVNREEWVCIGEQVCQAYLEILKKYAKEV